MCIPGIAGPKHLIYDWKMLNSAPCYIELPSSGMSWSHDSEPSRFQNSSSHTLVRFVNRMTRCTHRTIRCAVSTGWKHTYHPRDCSSDILPGRSSNHLVWLFRWVAGFSSLGNQLYIPVSVRFFLTGSAIWWHTVCSGAMPWIWRLFSYTTVPGGRPICYIRPYAVPPDTHPVNIPVPLSFWLCRWVTKMFKPVSYRCHKISIMNGHHESEIWEWDKSVTKAWLKPWPCQTPEASMRSSPYQLLRLSNQPVPVWIC